MWRWVKIVGALCFSFSSDRAVQLVKEGFVLLPRKEERRRGEYWVGIRRLPDCLNKAECCLQLEPSISHANSYLEQTGNPSMHAFRAVSASPIWQGFFGARPLVVLLGCCARRRLAALPWAENGWLHYGGAGSLERRRTAGVVARAGGHGLFEHDCCRQPPFHCGLP